jgi:multidrug efflux pump subunit AcrA (membrane-fusion protein)
MKKIFLKQNSAVFVTRGALLLIPLLMGWLTACRPGGGMKKEEEKPIVPVLIERAKKQPIRHVINLSGTIKGKNEVRVFSDVPGKVRRFNVQEGSYVKKGQVLMTLNRDVVGYEYKPVQVAAPISGYVGKIFPFVGQQVSPQTPLMFLVDYQEVYIETSVIEKHLGLTRRNQKALIRVEAYPERTFRGRVVKIEPIVDAATRSQSLKIYYANPGRKLRPGMFADIDLIVEEDRSHVVIPKNAAFMTDKGFFVYTVTKPKVHRVDDVFTDQQTDAVRGIAKRTTVTIGFAEGGRRQILTGLTPGDLIISLGHQNVIEGTIVQCADLKNIEIKGIPRAAPEREKTGADKKRHPAKKTPSPDGQAKPAQTSPDGQPAE